VAGGAVGRDPTGELPRILTELQQLERELVEQRFLRRVDGLPRVGDALRRLGEVGSAAGVIGRAARELGESSDFDRVIVSRVTDGQLVPVDSWCSAADAEGATDTAGLVGRSLPLAYPLVEAEVVQRRGALIVSVAEAGARLLPALRDGLGWNSYVLAAIEIEGTTAGLLHAARLDGGPPLDEIDLDLAGVYADGLGQAFERAVLRDALQRQRHQLRSAAQWIAAQTLRLRSDSPGDTPELRLHDPDVLELLTPRELEVVRLMARGLSNRGIASALVLGEGTVKYHVKNVLRKLRARSRSEAVSRYMTLDASRESA
jgi:LuxR family transcriptional regulator, regulator of acetate metabolism